MDSNLLYKIAYRKLSEVTPVNFDCGMLCDKKCCKGENEFGMQLFPGEELFLNRKADFLEMRDETAAGFSIKFAICQGKCKRNLRPLACRIYPLVPYLSANGKLLIIEDPRARYICPLLVLKNEFEISKIFKRKVYEVFRLLITDPGIKEHIRKLSTVLDDYLRFV